MFASAKKRGHGQECSSVSFTAQSVATKDWKPWQRPGRPLREADAEAGVAEWGWAAVEGAELGFRLDG